MKLPTINFNNDNNSFNGVDILELESLYNRGSSLDHDPGSPHRANFHLLIYITKGIGNHLIDFNYHPYETGSFIFIGKNQVHAFDFQNKPLGHAVLFTQDFADEISTKLRVPIFSLDYLMNSYAPIFTVTDVLKESSEALLFEIIRETNDKSCDVFIIQLLFSSLLLKLLRERPRKTNTRLTKVQINRLTQFLILVENNFSISRNASFYAEKMGISYKSLNKLCKSATDKTSKQLIDSYIILQIKRNLIVEKNQVKEIAYEMGFNEVTNFIKYFKKNTLVTPSQFKISHKG